MNKFTLLSYNGEDRLQCYLEIPDNAVGIVQICHGMCEFYDRYKNFRAALLSAGFAVCGHDQAGHGASVRDKDRYGYFGKKEGARVLVEDAYAVSKYVREKLPRLPLFLVGHSMGSFVIREYLRYYASQICAVILIGTAGPNPALHAGKLLAKCIRLFKGDKNRPALINKLAFGSYTKRIADAPTGYEWLSRNTDIIGEYAKDERCTFIFTVAGFIDLFELLGRVSNRRWATDIPGDLPILLVSGKEDPVGNYGKGVDIVYRRLLQAGNHNVTCQLYDGMRHEILSELGREQVEQDLIGWLKKRL